MMLNGCIVFVGPLAETGTQDGNQGPSLAMFHPCTSLFGQQVNSIVVTVALGDSLVQN